MRLLSHWFFLRLVTHMLLDLVLLVVTTVGICFLFVTDFWHYAPKTCVFAGIFSASLVMIQAWGGLYHRTLARSRKRAIVVLGLTVPIMASTLEVLDLSTVTPVAAQIGMLMVAAAVLINRVRVAHDQADSLLVRRVLVLGTGKQARQVHDALSRPNSPVTIAGFFPGPRPIAAQVPARSILNSDRTLYETAEAMNVDEIVVTLTERRGDDPGGSMPLEDLLNCKLKGMLIQDWPGFCERTFGYLRLDSLSNHGLVFGDGFSQSPARFLVKRVFDIAVAFVLLVLMLPIMALIAFMILVEDGRPVFYSQQRVGQNGRLFRIVKFRSMRRNAENSGQPVWAEPNDRRATRVGQMLRKFRLDELPQLPSVLAGHMSLVGPRPERPYFVEHLAKTIPFYNARLTVKPGLTGWAQVRYHYAGSVEDTAEKLQYDLYYVKNHSLLLDLIILYATVGVIVSGKGAY